MAEYPLDPQLAKMVVASPEFRSAFGGRARARARASARAARAAGCRERARACSQTLAHANEESPPWRGASRLPRGADPASVRHRLSRMLPTLK